MQECIAVGISFPKEYLKKIDLDRGDISRSRFIVKFLEKTYKTENTKYEDSLDVGLEFTKSSESSGGL